MEQHFVEEPCQEGWHRPVLSLFAKVFTVFSCKLPKVTCSRKRACLWQAEQAHLAGREKQEVPVGERPAVHIAVVCGFWQGASGWARPVFFLENFKTSSDFGEWLP